MKYEIGETVAVDGYPYSHHKNENRYRFTGKIIREDSCLAYNSHYGKDLFHYQIENEDGFLRLWLPSIALSSAEYIEFVDIEI